MTIIKNRPIRIVLIASLFIATWGIARQSDIALSINHQQESASLEGKAEELPKLALPALKAAQMPLYPNGAPQANIEGIVRVKITTDGHRVTSASAEKGSHPLLTKAAEENVRTWEFSIHEPTTFTVTYRYNLVTDLKPIDNNPRVILRLPTEVEVDALRWPSHVYMPIK